MGKFSVVDIFCGIGGISKGFEKSGFEIILGIDNDEYPLKIFKKQFPSADTMLADIRNIEASDILKRVGNKKIDVIVAGPPCQGFSIANRRNRWDKRNTLFSEFARIVKEIMPSWILMENVTGLLSAKMPDGQTAIDYIYDEFSPDFELKHFVANSADFGVPQKRKRVIFVGNSKGINFEFEMPKRKWKAISNFIKEKTVVDGKYFYSEKLIDGFRRREKINRERGYGFGWQFLKMSEPSYTIPARYWKDGSNALIKYSDNEIRMLTERECARIQGLDSRRFRKGGKKDYVAIGNAVPPKLAQPFAEKILEYGM